MGKYDVVVVGSGPAGSSAARAAASCGARVLMIDKKPRVGAPVRCAEFVPALINTLVDVPRQCVAQQVDFIESIYPDEFRVLTPAPGYVLNREIFDKHLVEEAITAGTELWLNCSAAYFKGNCIGLRRNGHYLEITADVIIGADGSCSRIAKGIGKPRHSLAFAAQVEIILPEPLDLARIYFHQRYRGGYAWVFPKGKSANVGVTSICGGVKLVEALSHFLLELNYQNAEIIGNVRGVAPVAGPFLSCSQGNVLLCGDAGGFTNPVTGAGIANAIFSGRLAGETASKYIGSGEPLNNYDQSWQDVFGDYFHNIVANRLSWNKALDDCPADLSVLLRKIWLP